MKRLAIVLLCVGLSGCASSLDTYTKNRACVTKIAVKGAYGSLTPTGTYSLSATCRPVGAGAPVEAKDVATPSPPT